MESSRAGSECQTFFIKGTIGETVLQIESNSRFD